ncbi:MAG: response regulator [Candidatus Gastranaerophilales bacterium]|nr:response regulator [Candidatus Gastranaerophilales bacterium]
MDKLGNILIVDDENMVTKTLSMLLGLEGFSNVAAFNSPFEALDYLKENEVDLIISDFIMPQMNGIDFLENAKKLQKDTSTILLTGYADKENAIRAINEIGIFKYIEKPWDNNNLIINIKNALTQTRLKKELDKKIEELEIVNKKLENYSKDLEETVQKRTLELMQANTKLNAVITNCADGIILFNQDMKITELNNAALYLFGQSKKELISKNLFELVVSEKKQFCSTDLKSKTNIFLRNYYLINYKKDAKIPVEISIAPVNDEKNNFYVAVIRDCTYQKETERLRDDFIATLTHDLRTPLLATISGLEFVLDKSLGEVTDKQNNLFEAMKKSSEDMLGLVNALLEVYRYEAGKTYLCKTKFDILRLADECIEELQSLAKKAEIKLEITKNEQEIFVNADKNEIRRVMVNLIGNAIKHSQNSSNVKINIEKNDKDLKVDVIDDGIGLSSEDCAKLFNRFSQGTNQKRSSSTGLGLYLSRQIIEAHSGKIYVESELNKGSKFTFELKNAINDCKVIL